MIESNVVMKKEIQLWFKFALLAFLLVGAPGAALAQSGSTGGSIGNDEKSLSGSRQERSVEPDQPARRSRPEPEEPRRASRRSGGGGGGGGGSFDGAWVVVAVGTVCPGTFTSAIVISSGRIIGQGIVSGSVSPSGGASAIGTAEGGVTIHSSGHFSGHSGSGSYHRTDGCAGRWTASKQ